VKGWVVVSQSSRNYLGITASGIGELSKLDWVSSKGEALRFASLVQARFAAEQWPDASAAVYHVSV
jgi:hypothetical protein